MQHFIEEGDSVNYDDGFDQLQAEVLTLHGDTAKIIFTKGNRRHPRKAIEEVALSHLFPVDQEEPEYYS